MATIASSIFQCFNSIMWLFSQPVNLIIYIFEVNYEAVSALFSAINSLLYYTWKALQLLLQGTFFMMDSIADGFETFEHVCSYVASRLFSLTKLIIQTSAYIVQAVITYGPYLWYGVTWLFRSLAYYISSTFNAASTHIKPSMIWEYLVDTGTLLYQTMSSALTPLISGLYASANSTLQAIPDVFQQLVNYLWQLELIVKSFIWNAVKFSYQKLDDIFFKIELVVSGVYGSLTEVFMNFLTIVSYMIILTVIVIIIILIPMKFYTLYVNAIEAANTLVGQFQRAIAGSRRNTRWHNEQRPLQNAEQRQPGEREVHVPAADESLLNSSRVRRRAPDLSQLGQQVGQQVPRPQPQANPSAPQSSQGIAGTSSTSHEQTQGQFIHRSAPPPPTSPGRQNPDTVTAQLAKQLEEERDRQLCVVCQDNDKNILILPCKHLCICLGCVEEITSQTMRNARVCPLCRGMIKSYMEIFA